LSFPGIGSHGAIVHKANVLLQTVKSCARAVALKADNTPKAIMTAILVFISALSSVAAKQNVGEAQRVEALQTPVSSTFNKVIYPSLFRAAYQPITCAGITGAAWPRGSAPPESTPVFVLSCTPST
jgi:hypothetical protein